MNLKVGGGAASLVVDIPSASRAAVVDDPESDDGASGNILQHTYSGEADRESGNGTPLLVDVRYETVVMSWNVSPPDLILRQTGGCTGA